MWSVGAHDTPDTCRSSLLAQTFQKFWAERQGAQVIAIRLDHNPSSPAEKYMPLT